MEKCKLCGAVLNPQTGNCDVCDGRVIPPSSAKPEKKLKNNGK